jgi:repressor LexA
MKKLSSLPGEIKPLTPKEKSVLDFIHQHVLKNGVSPSYQEIRDHFQLASFNSVQNYLKQLSQKGYVENTPHQKRALRILHGSNALQQDLKKRSPLSQSGSPRDQLLQARAETYSLPLLGSVAAGRPIERFEHNEFVQIPPHLVKKPDSTFVLKVQGDSMIDDGIWDGDYLLIEEKKTASNGDIVVASIDQEATVKRFYMRNKPDSDSEHPWVELRPSNSRLKSMWFNPEDVEIKGLVVGLVRSY